ncbi:hypothetical protein QUF49_10475 [Fictibacillus sp. b24]|uniref:hypothetical protein n=1 Tax=Fictibacillus sp. b24 TaxID=3055863 RepID=UPI0025A2271C|nr:hypothetical protein [Fictibacillus sp. b24]MDM5316417.1 hypothetical protein [Fictibacillus sp. b24]
MNIIRWISVIVLAVILCLVIWKGASENQRLSESLDINNITPGSLADRVTYPLQLTDSEWENLTESYQYFHEQGILVEDTWIKRSDNKQLSLTDVLVSHQEIQKGLQKYIQELQEKNLKHTDQIHSLRIDLTELQERIGMKNQSKEAETKAETKADGKGE